MLTVGVWTSVSFVLEVLQFQWAAYSTSDNIRSEIKKKN